MRHFLRHSRFEHFHRQQRGAWIWVSFGMALLHVGAGVGAFFWIKRKIGKPMFEATFDELRKDQEWLTRTTENSR